MARLSTQPATAQATALRSGFFALPFDSATVHLYARVHSAQTEDEEDASQAEAGGSKALFVTGLPLGATEKSLKVAFKQLYSGNKITTVQLLPSTASTPSLSLLSRELASASASTSATVEPLFTPALVPPALPPAPSAIISFTSAPSLPPAPYPSSLPLSLPSAPSYLITSAATHSLARPHPSTIIAHSDTWMSAFDARRAATIPAHYVPAAPVELTATQKKKAKAKAAKAGKNAPPAPGSAAAALAAHQAQLLKARDRTHNPDEVDEGEWTLVTSGGRHGKSLLPTGVAPSLTGYGEGRTVKVAKGDKKGRREDAGSDEEGEEGDKMDQGVKKIVGDGFYSFVKNQQRRDGQSRFSVRIRTSR